MRHIGICEICEKETEVFACFSTTEPISFLCCKDCFKKGLEPYIYTDDFEEYFNN